MRQLLKKKNKKREVIVHSLTHRSDAASIDFY